MALDIDNEDTLLGLAIGVIILGLGISMLFIRNYTGDGAVVLAIGLMTLAVVVAVRSEKLAKIREETALPQPKSELEPTKPISINATQAEQGVAPSQSVENSVSQTTQTMETTQPQQNEAPNVTEPAQQPQPSSEEPKKEEEPIAATPAAAPS